MFKYNYYKAKDVHDVCMRLSESKEKGRIIAGGTDVLVQIREQDKHWEGVELLIDITGLSSELGSICETETEVHIGAMATHTMIEQSEIIQNHLPFLSVACGTVGSPQIRNMGTIGGSICNASPAADPLTPLVACDTTVVIQGLQGIRMVRLVDFYLGKGKIDLEVGEFVTKFIVQKLPKEAKTQFVKLGRRKALAISRLNVAIVVLMNQETGVIKEARIAPGCVFIKPERVTKAEEALLGQKPSKELFSEVGKLVSEVMIERTGVRWSTEYKKPALEGVVEEALLLVTRKDV